MNDINTGQLFRDLQGALTDIFLIELYESVMENHEFRFNGNKRIVQVIQGMMFDRFSPDDIEMFLENGYPRSVRMER